MRHLIPASLLGVFLVTPALSEGTREADAHEHGHGTFNMAIEGDVVAIELETPAFDLLGFEYEAKTDIEKAAVESARTALADPITLFGLLESAECRIVEAEIEIGADAEDHDDEHHDGDHHDDEHHEDDDDHAKGDDHDDHHDEHDDEHDDHAKGEDHDDEHDHDEHADEGESDHSEIHAHYALDCDASDAINAVDMTAYFETFSNAEELDATILTDAGQASGELEPDSPDLSF